MEAHSTCYNEAMKTHLKALLPADFLQWGKSKGGPEDGWTDR